MEHSNGELQRRFSCGRAGEDIAYELANHPVFGPGEVVPVGREWAGRSRR